MKTSGVISAKAAFLSYIVLATLTAVTLDGDMRFYVLAAIALFAVKTYVDIVRRRMAEQEDAEREEQAARLEAAASAPVSDVVPRSEP